MTEAKELAALRHTIEVLQGWMREDNDKIHGKIDALTVANNESHVDFQSQLSKINTATTVNRVKLGFINGGIALFVSGIVSVVGSVIFFSMVRG